MQLVKSRVIIVSHKRCVATVLLTAAHFPVGTTQAVAHSLAKVRNHIQEGPDRSLEEKMTSGLNTLLEELSSGIMVTDDHQGYLDDAVLDVIILEQLRELWQKARYSTRTALATLSSAEE